MKQIFNLAKKDVFIFFLSPQAAVVIAGFLLLSAYFFLNYLGNFNLALYKGAAGQYIGAEKINLNQWVVENYYMTLVVLNLVLIPLGVIRSVVEEKKSGTWSLLYTYPISNLNLVLAKYLGSLVPILILQVFAGLFPFGLIFLGNPEVKLIISGFLALILSTIALHALCTALASFCNSQMTAGFISFLVLTMLYSLQLVAGTIAAEYSSLLYSFSPLYQAKEMIAGRVSLAAIYYHFAFVFFGLFLFWLSISNERHAK